jgi:hypothetical protein
MDEGSDMSQKVSLAEKLAQFSDYFAPRTVAEFNGHDINRHRIAWPSTRQSWRYW